MINPVLNRMKTNTSLFIVLKGFVSEENSDSNTYLLSLNHANAVASYLIEAGIEANRIQTIGMGNTDFIGNPDTPEGRALNNRVEYLLYEK
ncbi:MAG: OmpA family protein [Bacteroidetes bacterium]|nr:MAG: OmpA family protein [Bacteroidota bacterium]